MTEPHNNLNYNVFVRFRFNPVMRKTFQQEHIVPEYFVPLLAPWPALDSACVCRVPATAQGRYGPLSREYSLTAQGGFAEVLGLAAELCELMTPVTGTGQQPARASPPAGPLRRRVRSMPGCQGEGAGTATIAAQCVDFRRSTAAGRWVLMWVEFTKRVNAGPDGQGAEDRFPHTFPAPATTDGGVRAMGRRAILPASA